MQAILFRACFPDGFEYLIQLDHTVFDLARLGEGSPQLPRTTLGGICEYLLSQAAAQGWTRIVPLESFVVEGAVVQITGTEEFWIRQEATVVGSVPTTIH